MKKIYIEPQLTPILLQTTDVITASNELTLVERSKGDYWTW